MITTIDLSRSESGFSGSAEEHRSCEGFLLTLFHALDNFSIRYCVLHSWDELPERVCSDLDMALHPDDFAALPSVIEYLRNKGYVPVQVLNYLVGAYYFIFSWFDRLAVRSVAVDIIVEHRRGGLTIPSVPSLVWKTEIRSFLDSEPRGRIYLSASQESLEANNFTQASAPVEHIGGTARSGKGGSPGR